MPASNLWPEEHNVFRKKKEKMDLRWVPSAIGAFVVLCLCIVAFFTEPLSPSEIKLDTKPEREALVSEAAIKNLQRGDIVIFQNGVIRVVSTGFAEGSPERVAFFGDDFWFDINLLQKIATICKKDDLPRWAELEQKRLGILPAAQP